MKALDSARHIFVSMFQVSLVKWTESVGLPLVHRDLTTLTLRTPQGKLLTYTVLQIFPFTSESKRMGIIVRVSGFGDWSTEKPYNTQIHEYLLDISLLF